MFCHFKTLNDDVKLSLEKLNASDDEFIFHARVRAYASWIEGSIWLYKELVRSIENKWYLELSTECQLYLFEYDWSQKNSGQPTLKTKKISTKENLKGLLFVMSKLFDDFEYKLDESGWDNVMFFYTIRDRMMHPNHLSSMQIDKNDLKKCHDGRIWLEDKFNKIRTCIVKKIDS